MLVFNFKSDKLTMMKGTDKWLIQVERRFL